MNVSSSSNSNAYSALSGNKGIAGLASGMDTTEMVEKMLSGQQTKIDKQKANKQVAQWKQNIFRGVISKIDSFQKKFFDITSSTALHSNSFFNQMKATTTSSAFRVTGASSDAISGEMRVKINKLASATSLEGKSLNNINEIKATFNEDAFNARVAFTVEKPIRGADGSPVLDADGKPTYEKQNLVLSSDNIKDIMEGTSVELKIPKDASDPSAGDDVYKFSMTNGKLSIDGAYKMTVDASKLDTASTPPGDKGKTTTQYGLDMLGLTAGATTIPDSTDSKYKLTSKVDPDVKHSLSISLDGDKKTIEIAKGETYDSFSQKIKNAFGDSVSVVADPSDASSFTLKTTAGRKIVVSGTGSALEALNLKNGQSNLVGYGDTIEGALGFTFDSTGKYDLTINNETITLTKEDTISTMMSKLNKSAADINIEYDEYQNKFSISRDSMGKGFEIDFGADPQNFFSSLMGGTVDELKAAGNYKAGQNSEIEINGLVTERSSNNFTINGLSFELLSVSTGAADAISTTRDTDAVLTGIKSFVEDYNALLKELNGLLEAEADYKEYPPLTDAQRKELSQGEIDAWEKKAQVGLLRGDNDITGFLQQLRMSIYQKPPTAKYAMYDIGIETSQDTAKGGILEINESKLKEMLNSNMDDVQELFTYSKTKEQINYKGEKEKVLDGPQGISTAFKDIIKRYANTSSGSPGVLVQIAGYAKTGTDKKNALYDQMKDASDRIKTLTFQYEKQKTRYWNQFTAMEKAIASLSSQSSWLTQQMG